MAGAPPSAPPLEASGAATPLLPEGCAFEGLLTFRGTARVEGELTGAVVARGRLELGPRARVRARVDVDELVVEGRLEGEVRARVRAELRPSAHLRGGLDAPRVAIADGALLEGPCRTRARAAGGREAARGPREAGPGGEPPASAPAAASGPVAESP